MARLVVDREYDGDEFRAHATARGRAESAA
jgi:hypothetical protein